MKIKSIEVKVIWEDGAVNDVSSYLPAYVNNALETFSDWWEERYGYDEKEAEDESKDEDCDD
jgi:hypothetical protein